jgi:hypothetical protein
VAERILSLLPTTAPNSLDPGVLTEQHRLLSALGTEHHLRVPDWHALMVARLQLWSTDSSRPSDWELLVRTAMQYDCLASVLQGKSGAAAVHSIQAGILDNPPLLSPAEAHTLASALLEEGVRIPGLVPLLHADKPDVAREYMIAAMATAFGDFLPKGNPRRSMAAAQLIHAARICQATWMPGTADYDAVQSEWQQHRLRLTGRSGRLWMSIHQPITS